MDRPDPSCPPLRAPKAPEPTDPRAPVPSRIARGGLRCAGCGAAPVVVPSSRCAGAGGGASCATSHRGCQTTSWRRRRGSGSGTRGRGSRALARPSRPWRRHHPSRAPPHRVAEQSGGVLEQRANMGFMPRGDPRGGQHPAPPTVDTHQQPTFAVFAGGIEVQRVPFLHGLSQRRRSEQMQRFEIA